VFKTKEKEITLKKNKENAASQKIPNLVILVSHLVVFSVKDRQEMCQNV